MNARKRLRDSDDEISASSEDLTPPPPPTKKVRTGLMAPPGSPERVDDIETNALTLFLAATNLQKESSPSKDDPMDFVLTPAKSPKR